MFKIIQIKIQFGISFIHFMNSSALLKISFSSLFCKSSISRMNPFAWNISTIGVWLRSPPFKSGHPLIMSWMKEMHSIIKVSLYFCSRTSGIKSINPIYFMKFTNSKSAKSILLSTLIQYFPYLGCWHLSIFISISMKSSSEFFVGKQAWRVIPSYRTLDKTSIPFKNLSLFLWLSDL